MIYYWYTTGRRTVQKLKQTCRTFSNADLVPSNSNVQLHNFLPQGFMEYGRSWAWQQTLLSRRLRSRRLGEDSFSDRDCVIFVEHEPVYTLGRGADETHIAFLNDDDPSEDIRLALDKLSRKSRGPTSARLSVDRRYVDEEKLAGLSLEDAVENLSSVASPVMAPNGAPIYRVERGGEVTFHGPKQLVVYPLFDLQREPFKKDLHWYLRMVEEVVIQTLKQFKIEGKRDEINTGVWVGEEKIAAVGVSSSRWITTHGFALNVDPDLSFFDTSIILPCGIEGRGVTSMSKEVSQTNHGRSTPELEEVSKVVIQEIQNVFSVNIERC